MSFTFQIDNYIDPSYIQRHTVKEPEKKKKKIYRSSLTSRTIKLKITPDYFTTLSTSIGASLH